MRLRKRQRKSFVRRFVKKKERRGFIQKKKTKKKEEGTLEETCRHWESKRGIGKVKFLNGWMRKF